MTPLRVLSPAELEQRWKLQERNIVNWLHALDSRVLMLIVAFSIVTLAAFSSFIITDGRITQFSGGFRMMKLARDSIPVAVLLSFILLHLNHFRRKVFQIASLFLVWIITSYVDLTQTAQFTLGSASVLTLLPILCGISFFYLRTNAKFRQSAIGLSLYTIAFWSVYLCGVWILAVHNASYIFLALLKLKTPFLWLTSMVFAFEKTGDYEAVSISFNPINAIYGVLWPYDFHTEKERAARDRLWWSGAVLLMWAYVLLIFRAWGSGFFPESLGVSLTRSVGMYFLVLIGDISSANAVTGLARVFGFGVRDATSFAFLSRKPSEFWKRISVYNYLFVLQYIKLPLYRKYRSQFWSTFVAFWFYFLTRRVIDVVQNVAGPIASYQDPLLLQLLRFLSLVLMIIVTQKYWFISREAMERPVKGWLSIALCHLTFIVFNSGIWYGYHYFVPNPSWLA